MSMNVYNADEYLNFVEACKVGDMNEVKRKLNGDLNNSILNISILVTIEYNNMEILKVLVEDGRFVIDYLDFKYCVREDKLDIFKYFIEVVDSDVYTYDMFYDIIMLGKEEFVIELLKVDVIIDLLDDNIFYGFNVNGMDRVVDYMIGDPRIVKKLNKYVISVHSYLYSRLCEILSCSSLNEIENVLKVM